jgi:hypothetical protein
MKIAILESHTDHYYRIQHFVNTLRKSHLVVKIKNIDELNKESFDIFFMEYFSSYTSNPHEEMYLRFESYKSELLRFKGKVCLYNVDDGSATYIKNMSVELANRIDAWFVFMINLGFLGDNNLISNIISNKFVLLPRYTIPYIDTTSIDYENKQNKIVFVGRSTGNYWFNGKNWRVECLNKIWSNKKLSENFDGWMVDDKIIDVNYQNEEYNKTFKFIKKNNFLSEQRWLTKLKENTLSLCIPGHTKYGYRHPQSMALKSTMLCNFDLEHDPYRWLFSEKLKNISYLVKEDLSNFDEVCEESLFNREKTKAYSELAYDVYKSYIEVTKENQYQSHIWKLIQDKLESLNICGI